MKTHKKLDRSKLAALFRAARSKLGWTVRRTEEELGVPYSIVNKAERADAETYRTSSDHVLVLCDGYDVDYRHALVSVPAEEVFHGNTPAKQDAAAREVTT